MDWGAWRAIVQGVIKSQTQLKCFTIETGGSAQLLSQEVVIREVPQCSKRIRMDWAWWITVSVLAFRYYSKFSGRAEVRFWSCGLIQGCKQAQMYPVMDVGQLTPSLFWYWWKLQLLHCAKHDFFAYVREQLYLQRNNPDFYRTALILSPLAVLFTEQNYFSDLGPIWLIPTLSDENQFPVLIPALSSMSLFFSFILSCSVPPMYICKYMYNI